jgi:hypothetical protein
MNQAYLRNIFNDTIVVSGQQFMPFNPILKKEMSKIVNCIGNTVYPILLSLCMPVFLTNLVMEKEQRLTLNMKMNGL